MSVDAYNNLQSSSILLKKVRPINNVVVIRDHDQPPPSPVPTVMVENKKKFSKLHSLVASVSKRRVTAAATTTKGDNLNKYGSTTSLPTEPLKPPMRLKPSISARPFSQFFFPIKEEPGKEQQQQQTKPIIKKRLNKRHSIAMDLIETPDEMISASSSRSSSLKTVKNQPIMDNVVIATTTSDLNPCIQSDITFLTTTSNKRLSGVARARTVLRFDSNHKREMKALDVWKDTITQLSEDVEENRLEAEKDLYHILSHPALLVTI